MTVGVENSTVSLRSRECYRTATVRESVPEPMRGANRGIERLDAESQ